jgi:hypothetical protein
MTLSPDSTATQKASRPLGWARTWENHVWLPSWITSKEVLPWESTVSNFCEFGMSQPVATLALVFLAEITNIYRYFRNNQNPLTVDPLFHCSTRPTAAFDPHSTPWSPFCSWGEAQLSLRELRDEIFGVPPAMSCNGNGHKTCWNLGAVILNMEKHLGCLVP